MTDSKKLRIAMIVGAFPVYSETFITRKIDYLIQRGHDVHVFCRRFDRSMFNAAVYKKIVHRLRGVRKTRFERCFRSCENFLKTVIYDAKSIKKMFRTESNIHHFLNCSASSFFAQNWDIVHCHYLVNVGMIQEIRREIACPVIASIYGYDATVFPYNSPQNFADAQAWIKQVDGLIYCCEFLRGETRKIASTDGLVESVIFSETPTDFFTPRMRETPHAPFRILSVGRLHWAKGYPTALQAVKILRDRNVDFQYRIIGEGESRAELEYIIRNRGLQNYVSLVGRQTPEEVREAMQWADVCLLSSTKEEFGGVLPEAQASGLPVVASRIGGLPESTSDGQTSLLVEPGNPTAFADALIKLYNDTALFRRMSAQGPIFAKKFDTNESGKQLEQFYNECIEHLAFKK